MPTQPPQTRSRPCFSVSHPATKQSRINVSYLLEPKYLKKFTATSSLDQASKRRVKNLTSGKLKYSVKSLRSQGSFRVWCNASDVYLSLIEREVRTVSFRSEFFSPHYKSHFEVYTNWRVHIYVRLQVGTVSYWIWN